MLAEGWRDVSVPIRSEMPTWPGDPPVWVREVEAFEQEDPARVSVLSMGSHTGTHLDAPAHYLRDGATIDEIDPGVGLGPAHVLHVEDAAIVEPDHFADLDLDGIERLLIRTRNSPALWEEDDFVDTFAHLSTEAAEHLAEADLDLVGIDYLSVAGYQLNETPVHRALLETGTWILEGLNLAGVPEGEVELACLPLKVDGCDGAPARALVRRR
jgi:arylformamidase